MCRVLDIQPYVLRYWQTEFPVLASKKSAGGRREYDAEDLETIRRIKELLYDEGHTIASAKKKLAAELEEGGVRGRPLMVTEARANGGELPAEEGQGDDAETEEAETEEPEGGGGAGQLSRRCGGLRRRRDRSFDPPRREARGWGCGARFAGAPACGRAQA